MPITDYKVTDIERDAVKMEGKADPLTGTLAQNQAEFDEYPELIRDNLDGLCDFLTNMTFTHTVDTIAATNAKTAITGFIPIGAVVEIIFTNGNTAAAPTIAIDGVTHTISGLFTVAKLSSSANQTYRFYRSGASTLTFLQYPDYICESGTTGEWKYCRWASGKSEAWAIESSVTIANAASFGTGGLYTLYGAGTIPSGFFNATPVITGAYFAQASSIAGTTVYATSSTAFGCMGLRNSNVSTAVTLNIYAIGTWK